MSQRMPSVNPPGQEIVGKDPAVRHLAGVDIDVEHADMRRIVRTVGDACVDHIELLLVGREGNTVELHEVVDHNLGVTGFRIDPEYVVLLLLLPGLDALVVAGDAVYPDQ